jgi:hypothetical protein
VLPRIACASRATRTAWVFTSSSENLRPDLTPERLREGIILTAVLAGGLAQSSASSRRSSACRSTIPFIRSRYRARTARSRSGSKLSPRAVESVRSQPHDGHDLALLVDKRLYGEGRTASWEERERSIRSKARRRALDHLSSLGCMPEARTGSRSRRGRVTPPLSHFDRQRVRRTRTVR